MILINTTTIAITTRIWMNPPIEPAAAHRHGHAGF
jgi:hypothetical protein